MGQNARFMLAHLSNVDRAGEVHHHALSFRVMYRPRWGMGAGGWYDLGSVSRTFSSEADACDAILAHHEEQLSIGRQLCDYQIVKSVLTECTVAMRMVVRRDPELLSLETL